MKKSIDADPRYKAVDSSSTREDWFKDYTSKLSPPQSSDKDASDKDKEKMEADDSKKDVREEVDVMITWSKFRKVWLLLGIRRIWYGRSKAGKAEG